jgi:DNA (cytosine-5)-methyltransferase 1
LRLTHIDLFSGIGGFALAARWAGIETIQFVEIDPFCCKVLAKNFSGVPIHHDIKTFTNAECNRCNGETVSIQPRETRQGCTLSSGRNSRPFILTGGFPCQPFSCAGKRKGTSDDRHLWPEMLRVIQELSPRWVVAENVSGIVNIKNVVEQGSDADMEDEAIDGGEGGVSTSTLVSILADLEQSGYSVQVFIVPACAVGAPHRRDRIWILAFDSEGVPNRLDAPEHEGREDDPGRLKQDAPDSGTTDVFGRCDRGDTDSDRVETSQPPRSEPRGEYARCYKDGWSENWPEVATRFCRMDDGVSEELYKLETSDRVQRLKALGNAIVPQVAYELMKAILEADP